MLGSTSVILKRSTQAVIATLVILAILCWTVAAFYPSRNYKTLTDAGQFGDSFGLATSLFSSFGFIAGMVALILQIVERHESGERDERLKQLQLDQLRVTQRTASIQEANLHNQTSRLVMETLIQVTRNLSQLRDAWVTHVTVARGGVHIVGTPQATRRQMDLVRLAVASDASTVRMLIGRAGHELASILDELQRFADVNMEYGTDNFDEIQSRVAILSEEIWAEQQRTQQRFEQAAE